MNKLLLGISLLLCVVTFTACANNDDQVKTIKVYTRDVTSGTRDGFFTTIDFSDAIKDNAKLVNGYVEVDGNGSMIESVKNDEYGIGYISLSSLNSSDLNGVKFNDVEPTESNVLNKSYKLTRNFNYMIRAEFDSEKKEKIVEAYVAFLNTKDAKTTIKNNGGIVEIKNDDKTWNEIKANYPIANEDNSSITLRFGGSTSVTKIAQELSKEFKSKCGNFQAEHNHTGSGDAYKRTQGSEKDGANKLDIAFASREFKDSEKGAEGTSGFICVDAIVVVVNKKNNVTNFTKEMLKKIYDGSITKWNEAKQ